MANVANKQRVARLRNLSAVLPAGKAYYESSGIQSRDLGIAPPDDADRPSLAENGAGNVTGTVNYLITYYAETWASEGNPHATSVAITTSAKSVRLTFNDTPPSFVSHRRVYRTVDGGNSYFRVASVAVAASTYDDSTLDATLTSLSALEIDNDLPVSDMQGPVELGARLFAFKESKLYGSKASNPDQWPAANVLQIARDNGDDIRCLAAHGDLLVIYKDSSIHTLVYNQDPFDISDAYVQPNHYGRGALNLACVLRHGAIHIVLDRAGVYLHRGGGEIIDISQNIAPIFDALDWAQADWFCGVIDRGLAHFFVALSGEGGEASDGRLHWALSLDLESLASDTGPVWWFQRYDHPIRDVCAFEFGLDATIAAGARYRAPLAIDKYGTLLCLGHLLSDGGIPELTLEGVVASWSESDTRCNVTDGVFAATDFDSYDVTRLFVRFEDAGVRSEHLRMSAVGSGYFDFATTPTPLPSVGASFVIGGIQALLRTKTLDFERVFERKRVSRVSLAWQALPFARSMRVRAVRDASGAAPIGQAVNFGGQSATPGDDFHTVSLGGDPATSGGLGLIEVAVDGESFFAINFEIETFGAGCALSLHTLEVSGGTL